MVNPKSILSKVLHSYNNVTIGRLNLNLYFNCARSIISPTFDDSTPCLSQESVAFIKTKNHIPVSQQLQCDKDKDPSLLKDDKSQTMAYFLHPFNGSSDVSIFKHDVNNRQSISQETSLSVYISLNDYHCKLLESKLSNKEPQCKEVLTSERNITSP